MQKKVSKRWFHEYERIISDVLIKQGKGNNDLFTKDEVIDFFIQGASIAHKMPAIKYDNTICNFEEMIHINNSGKFKNKKNISITILGCKHYI